MTKYFGQECFEDLMTREVADPEEIATIHLSDVAAELHRSERELGMFAYEHLETYDYDVERGTVTEQGRDLLMLFVSRGEH